jgi:hypothetical protein
MVDAGKLGHFAALGEPVWPTVSIVPAFPVAAPLCVSLSLASWFRHGK